MRSFSSKINCLTYEKFIVENVQSFNSRENRHGYETLAYLYLIFILTIVLIKLNDLANIDCRYSKTFKEFNTPFCARATIHLPLCVSVEKM
jgi:hypothetical protein